MKEADAIYRDTFYNMSPGDSDLWLELFMYADRIDPELCGILQWLRNTGTMLKPDAKWNYKLVPYVGDEGWSSREEYQQESVALKPYRNQLIMILKKLPEMGRISSQNVPNSVRDKSIEQPKETPLWEQ